MNDKEFASIEYSKKLADIFQDSEWFWQFMEEPDSYDLVHKDDRYVLEECCIPAITIHMALDKLPYCISIKKRKHTHEYFLEIHKIAMGYMVGYIGLHRTSDKSLPDSLCQMLIHLKEKGLV